MLKNKKAFTLVEVIIVLMIIGVIAAITIPLIADNQSAYKQSYKKAYNVLANAIATEKTLNNLPADASIGSLVGFFSTLNSKTNVLGYSTIDINSATEPKIIYAALKWNNNNYGSENAKSIANVPEPEIDKWSPWIITEDNLAYSLLAPSNGQCGSNAVINSAETTSDAVKYSCLVILVDVNGLSKKPNIIEPQVISGLSDVKKDMKKLTGDRYYIYLANDGIAIGSNNTVSGRLINGLN